MASTATAAQENHNPNTEGEGEGDTFDDIFDSYREKRVAEMKKQAAMQEEMKVRSHGIYTVLENEKDLVAAMKNSKKVICHFGMPSFRTCTVLDGHLRTLAAKHFSARFVFVNVEKAPFMVTKLNIKVLPFVGIFIDSAAVDALVGFADLGNSETFTTAQLEKRLAKSGVIFDDKIKALVQKKKSTIKQGSVATANDSSGDEADE